MSYTDNLENNFLEEEWKSITFLSEKYQVSNLGRIKNQETGKILKSKLFQRKGDKDFYERITITYLGKVYTYKVHRLVLLVFEPISNPEKYHSHHKNNITTDNKLSNLEWLTCYQNQRRKRTTKKPGRGAKKLFKQLLEKYGDDILYGKLSQL